MPLIALRDPNADVAMLAGSGVLMSIDGIRGTSQVQEHEGWLALTNFDWGGTRVIRIEARMMGGTASAVAPQLRAVTVTRPSDFLSPEIWNLMCSSTKKRVEFAWLRTGAGGTAPYKKLVLENALVTGMSHHSAGALPEETISFTYEEVTLTVVNVGNRLSGPQDVVSYKVPQAKRA